MPCEDKAVKVFEKAEVTFGPAKAANAGGVAVSGLEMVQNRVGLQWSRDEVGGCQGADSRLACLHAAVAAQHCTALDCHLQMQG
jgi:glutamate dehydrogenase/leucine dehydrogenase